jgi:hypothetical protein
MTYTVLNKNDDNDDDDNHNFDPYGINFMNMWQECRIQRSECPSVLRSNSLIYIYISISLYIYILWQLNIYA